MSASYPNQNQYRHVSQYSQSSNSYDNNTIIQIFNAHSSSPNINPLPTQLTGHQLDNIQIQDPQKHSPETSTSYPHQLLFANSILRKREFSATRSRKCSVCNKPLRKGTVYAKRKWSDIDQKHSDMDENYTLCKDCWTIIKNYQNQKENIGRNDMPEMHDKTKLYFIYNDHQISGPHTNDEIVALYVRRQIKTTKIWVTHAHANDKNETTWHKLLLSMDNLDLKKFEEKNKEFKEYFPEIYKTLSQNVITQNIRRIDIPKNVPQDAISESTYLKSIHFSGKLFTTLMWIYISFHFIISYIITYCLYWIPVSTCCKERAFVKVIWYLLGYSGIILVPCVITHIALSSNMYSEIQSWMVAYIIWGCVSYITTACLFITYTVQKTKHYGIIAKYLLLVIGVELGHGLRELADADDNDENDSNDFDTNNCMDDCNECLTSLTSLLSVADYLEYYDDMMSNPDCYISFIFPALASFLPASICGFISNFILEEKFLISCHENVSNLVSSLCFPSYGCCEIESSYELKNSYIFIGGLSSNILAIWAVIRFVGFLMVNAIPSFALYAKRTQRG